ncbi:cytochrome P450 [Xylanibacillus composti]|uniref:cytochrome P450 n=1 Tax=Xylanibacillus composti TaxID=1572762 RepID=UPI001FD5378A|nr:cytochrome P450 [Xylanibacillus composti]
MEQRRLDREDHGDLLSMLMHAQDEDGAMMSNEQLRDEVMTLFLAGHETTANTLSWTFYLLTQHPEAESKLMRELEQVLNGQAPSFRHFPQLVYTQSIVKEAMRLYPPVWLISREPLEDVQLEQYVLPAGCEIALSQWVMHRHPDYFPEPRSFIPDRWTPEFEEALPAYVYFPFGAGPRMCIGNNFAMLEATLLLAGVLQQYRIVYDSAKPVAPEPSITLRPKPGVPVRVVRRRE